MVTLSLGDSDTAILLGVLEKLPTPETVTAAVLDRRGRVSLTTPDAKWLEQHLVDVKRELLEKGKLSGKERRAVGVLSRLIPLLSYRLR